MNITLDNYEEYFVRYVDSDLSETEQAAVLLFLEQHPELNAELKAFKATVMLPDDLVEFPGKKNLKQREKNYDELFIRYVENDLSADEVERVNQLVANDPQLKAELNSFKATILSADDAVKFSEKESLKQPEINYDEIFVRYVENDLSATEISNVNLMVS